MTIQPRLAALEFFAGGGMSRLGLGSAWDVVFANDCDRLKVAAYQAAFGHAPDPRDVWTLRAGDIPARADLAWASSPCQDVSLAGARAGLTAERSGAFFGFWRLIEALQDAGRAPPVIAIENVRGLLTSGNGRDFARIAAVLAERGYRFGALEMDAADFLPQSRPRVFIVALADGIAVPPGLQDAGASAPFRTDAVRSAFDALTPALAARWCWWRLPAPPRRNTRLVDLLEPDCGCWHAPAKTAGLLDQMAPRQRARLEAARAEGPTVAAVYRRIRVEDGARVQRAEARFDGLAGCIRTAKGGSSRQFLLFADASGVRSRALTAREAARLMGLPDEHPLPRGETAGLHVIGDGVAVPVVAWLADHLLTPLARAARATAGTAAA